MLPDVAAMACLPKRVNNHMPACPAAPGAAGQEDPHQLHGSQAQYVRVPLAAGTLVKVSTSSPTGSRAWPLAAHVVC